MRRGAALLGAAALGGCSLAPAYRPPVVPVAAAFKEAGPWTPAAPAAPAGGAWWTAFGDPVLDGLERRAAADNPTIQAALGRYQQAEGYLRQFRAAQLPTVGTRVDITQNRQSDHRPLRSANQPTYYAADTIGGTVAWDLDLWGGLRNRVVAGRAEAEASGDDLAETRLALAAQLALAYVDLRGLDAQARLLGETVDAYRQADDLAQRRYQGGITSQIDVARAGALLADARAQADDVAAARALLEHAIASLAGQSASQFALAPIDAQLAVPAVPAGLPSTLLQRRPDVAAAERRMVAANAGIGVARAAFYPSLTLGGGGGFQNTALAGLVSAPDSFWSIGPSLVLSIFDGGRRRARLAVARAAWTQATADYRARVLQAFQDVEDGLAQIHHLADEARDEDEAARQAGEAERQALIRYDKGVVTYLDVSTAQATALGTRERALALQTRRLEASIRLVRATGGGWTPAAPPAMTGAGTS